MQIEVRKPREQTSAGKKKCASQWPRTRADAYGALPIVDRVSVATCARVPRPGATIETANPQQPVSSVGRPSRPRLGAWVGSRGGSEDWMKAPVHPGRALAGREGGREGRE